MLLSPEFAVQRANRTRLLLSHRQVAKILLADPSSAPIVSAEQDMFVLPLQSEIEFLPHQPLPEIRLQGHHVTTQPMHIVARHAYSLSMRMETSLLNFEHLVSNYLVYSFLHLFETI